MFDGLILIRLKNEDELKECGKREQGIYYYLNENIAAIRFVKIIKTKQTINLDLGRYKKEQQYSIDDLKVISAKIILKLYEDGSLDEKYIDKCFLIENKQKE